MPSIPLFPGITTSISTTSGLCSIASKTARSAFGASPTVSMSGSASRTRRRPARTTAWSSTTSTRITERHLGHERRPAAGADSTQAPAEERDALAHADEPEAVVAGRLGSKPAPSSSIDGGDDAVSPASAGC